MQIHDIVESLTKHPRLRYKTRQLSQIENLVIHHYALVARVENVAHSHVWTVNQYKPQEWPGIGYHFCIEPDGRIWQTNRLETISYHCGIHNTRSIGIALNGSFQTIKPPQLQQDAAHDLVNYLRRQPGLYIIRTLGHRELGIQTACPGNTYKQWLPYVVSEKPSESVKPAPNPEPDLLSTTVQRLDRLQDWAVSKGYIP
jgi:N-acetyl-anhydromuramyl-L-alanine amidase AmpD